MVRSWFALAGRVSPGMLVRCARLGATPLVRRPASVASVACLLFVAAQAERAATPSQPGLQEWRQAGPTPSGAPEARPGGGTRTISSGYGEGTIIPDQHVLRVEVKVSLAGFTDPEEAWMGAAGYDVDAQVHGTVKKISVSSQNYICTSIPHDGTKGTLVFHIVNPSGTSNTPDPRTVTVGYFVREGSTWYHGTTEYTIRRFNCYDAAIDSRRMFGDPNSAVILEEQANATARNALFGSWTYRGGLFAGHMPWETSSDRSGTARSQFYYDPGSISIKASVLTLFRRGYDNANQAIDRGSPVLGVFMPATGSANLVTSGSALESGSTWDARLAITPSGNPASENDDHQWDLNPLSTPSVYLRDEYVNFALQKYKTNGDLIGSEVAHNSKHLVVALADETELSSGGDNMWRYFASSEYQTGATGIYSDSQPRVWTLTEGSTSSFSVVSVSE